VGVLLRTGTSALRGSGISIGESMGCLLSPPSPPEEEREKNERRYSVYNELRTFDGFLFLTTDSTAFGHF
jgi:hypothetical protein